MVIFAANIDKMAKILYNCWFFINLPKAGIKDSFCIFTRP